MMFFRKGFQNNASQNDTYKTVTDINRFFREFDLPEQSKTRAEKLSPVAAAHRIYTNAIGGMPLLIRQKVGDKRIEADHKLSYVLKTRANTRMSPFMAKKIIVSQAFWHGAGYAIIERDKTGGVVGILPVPTEGHQEYFDSREGTVWHAFSVDENQYGKKLTRKFAESELLIFLFESYDGFSGRGLLDLARETIRADAMAQQYGEKFYKNGARVSGILEVPGELKAENRELVKKDFEEMATGMDNAFKVAVLDLGMKYTQLGITQKDSQFLETRSFSVEETSRFTGIPAYMLQTGKQSYQSNEQQQLDFVTNTLVAPVTQIEQEWTYKLFSEEDKKRGFYLKGNVSYLLRGDNESRSRFYEKMIGLGIYSQDECRALEDMSPLPDGAGKNYWMSKNYDTIENVTRGGGNGGN